MRIDDNVAAGMSKEEAHRDAVLRFGSRALMKERVTSADAALMLDGMARDTRYAIRRSFRSPAFALTAIVTLALGIGANVVVFGVLNSLILHPINVAGSSARLFSLVQKPHGNDNQSYPDYLDFRSRNNTLSDMVAYKLYDAALSVNGVAKKSWFYEVSGNYFSHARPTSSTGTVLRPQR